MKKMTCKELGGACDKVFVAATFDEIATMSKNHAMQMWQQKDKAHIEAMERMQELMKSPDAMNLWMDEKRKAFNNLPE